MECPVVVVLNLESKECTVVDTSSLGDISGKGVLSLCGHTVVPLIMNFLMSKLPLFGERDTLRGDPIENWGYLFVYICVWTYVCHFVL